MPNVPNEVVRYQQIIYNNHFLWKTSNPKTKHEPKRKSYTDRDLKNVDIPRKVVILQRSWIKKL